MTLLQKCTPKHDSRDRFVSVGSTPNGQMGGMASRTYSPGELVGQSAVCDTLGITVRTLARRLAHYKASGEDSDIPPFVMVGKQRRWRYDYLVAFRDGRTSLRGLQSHGYPAGSVAYTSDEPQAHKPLSVRAVVRMIEGWKVRELYRRYEAIADPSAKTSDLFEAHQAERRLLYDAEGNRRSRDDPGVMEALVAKAQQIAQPEGTAYRPEQLASLMQTVWEQVLDEERGWLIGRP